MKPAAGRAYAGLAQAPSRQLVGSHGRREPSRSRRPRRPASGHFGPAGRPAPPTAPGEGHQGARPEPRRPSPPTKAERASEERLALRGRQLAATAPAPARESWTGRGGLGRERPWPVERPPHTPERRCCPGSPRPNAPPSSRAVLLIADATPCLDRGSARIMTTVSGLIAKPMPPPTRKSVIATNG